MPSKKLTFSLLGNPNCGKTAVFNLLTGMNQKVSNYPGITVEKKVAEIKINSSINVTLEDYPGAYSLVPQSLDEKIVSDAIIKWIQYPNERPDGIIYIADITNLRRNLYFFSQLQSLGIPIIMLLNMYDIAEKNIINIEQFHKYTGIFKIIPFSAAKKIGLNSLKETIAQFSNDSLYNINNLYLTLSNEYKKIIHPLSKQIKKIFSTTDNISEQISFSLICHRSYIGKINLNQEDLMTITSIKTRILDKFDLNMKEYLKTLESDIRYGYIDTILSNSNYIGNTKIEKISKSEKIDKILTNKWLGPFIYVLILYFIFQSIFTWATIPMNYIDTLVGNFGNYIQTIMPDNILRDLLVNGIIAGVGAVIIFLPQILLLMFFMTLLEDTGYMTRISFIMDKFMRKMGLHGKSILPIMSGYACAIPGIISTRTIDSRKERLITILILPLVSCSARLPIYVLMIGAFIPNIYIFDFFGLQGLVMVIMYFLGTITAFILAKVFSRFLMEKSNPTFIMELPPYRYPIFQSIFKQVYNRGKLFLIDAGKIIMLISVVLWFLVSFPKNEYHETSIDKSYAGQVGHFIEPIIKPLGFDWKIGIGLITSFAAREVMVSTLSTIYNVQDSGDNMVNLKEAMKNDINKETGKHLYTPLVALSLMIFYVYAAQCMATFAVVKTETNTWKWPLFMITYMTLLAYFMSLFVFQVGRLIGLN